MAEDTTPTAPGKKHRIIHWNPDADKKPAGRRWTIWRVLGWTAGGFFGLLLTAGLVIRAAKLLWGPGIFQSQSAQAAAAAGNDPSTTFVSQSKAELAHETAAKALAELRRLPQNHPVQLQQLILIEKSFLVGETLLGSHEYAKAYAQFDALNREIDDFSKSIKLKQAAQQAYDTILVKVKDLEIARSLAPEALEAAFTAAGTGRRFLNEGSFAAAKKTFDEGLAELRKAEKTLSDFIEGNLHRGQQALNQGAREVAAAAFKAALEKSPGDEAAQQGLKRAETIDRVYALLRQGESLEKQGQYSPAAEAYGKAFSVDKFSAAAQEGKARAERLALDTAFHTAMSAAKAAEARRDWAKAIQGYEAALKVYPAKAEVRKALSAARESAHSEAVRHTLAKAYDYENKYQWNEARAGYYDTLQLEPEQADAKEGYVRTGRVIRALLQYEKLIEAAQERLARAEFQAGIRAFNEAMAIKPAYLAPSDKVQQLRTLLLEQNQPVEITFKSDGKTFVSISNYRMLGKFDHQALKILPGDYEVVGRRKGYQDVLLLLQVRHGSPPPQVAIACNLRAQS